MGALHVYVTLHYWTDEFYRVFGLKLLGTISLTENEISLEQYHVDILMYLIFISIN